MSRKHWSSKEVILLRQQNLNSSLTYKSEANRLVVHWCISAQYLMETLPQLLKQNACALRCRKSITINNINWSMHRRFWQLSQGPYGTKIPNCLRKPSYLKIWSILHVAQEQKGLPSAIWTGERDRGTTLPICSQWISVPCNTASSSSTTMQGVDENYLLGPLSLESLI